MDVTKRGGKIMKLVIGGRAQGKLKHVLQEGGFTAEQVCDGENCPLPQITAQKPVLNHLHLLVRRLLQEGKEPDCFVEQMLAENPSVVIITDEIGLGIVPVDAFEREWRERTGRICCELAARADRVERVFAGIATVLKG